MVRLRIPRLQSPALADLVKRATGADTVALDQRLQSLWGGYGELWRGELTHGATVTRAVVKHVRPPPGDVSRSHRRKLRSYEVEHAFYERYAARCGEPPICRVPRPIRLLHENGGWLFVLEDLDASGFSERRAHAQPADISATLRWLAGFHARFLGIEPDGLWRVGTYWQLATRPDELGRMKHAALRRAAPAVDAALNAARFKTLVHGDAKLENVCFASARGADVALVDFQYVGGGVGVKDVAYFLSSCLSPRECESLVPAYLDDYFRALESAVAANAIDVDVRELEREWRALFPLAWIDFYRFLLGWAPGQLDDDPYSERLTSEVLARLSSA